MDGSRLVTLELTTDIGRLYVWFSIKDLRSISPNGRVLIDSPDNDEVNKIKAFQTWFDLNRSHLLLHPPKRKVRLTTGSSEVSAPKGFWSWWRWGCWWRWLAAPLTPMLGKFINWIIGELNPDSSWGWERWGW